MLSTVQELKIKIMTEGISISPSAFSRMEDLHGKRPLTLADYASTSGIALCLEGDIWVNAPFAEHNANFVVAPTVALDVVSDQFVVICGKVMIPARPLPVPDYYGKRNRWGELYTDYCHTHTDRARISPIEGCANACRFCNLPYDYQYRLKKEVPLLDSLEAAVADLLLPARHVLVSGGTPASKDYGYLNAVYESVLSCYTHLPVDIMMGPVPSLLDLDKLGRLGVNQLAINLELYNAELARKYMPEKAGIGLAAYLDFIEKAVGCLGPGRVRSLVLVGLEDAADTLAAVAALAERGCEPVLSPFRPSPATPLGALPPPGVSDLATIYLKSRDIAEQKGVKLGPRCVPCMHNTLTFPDDSGYYYSH
jgi:hypothetical protein